MSDNVTQVTPHDDFVLVTVLKRTLNAASTEALADTVLATAGAHPKPIVLDLSKVNFAPSVALGALVQMSKSFSLDGRRIALIGVQPRVYEAITVTRLDTVLEIHKDLAAYQNAN